MTPDFYDPFVGCHEFVTVPFETRYQVPDTVLGNNPVDLKVYVDKALEAHVIQLRSKITANVTSKTVHLSEVVEFEVSVPKTWFDTLILQHPWVNLLCPWYTPKKVKIEKSQKVEKSEKVEFAALIPEITPPAEVLRDHHKEFTLYYKVL